MHSLGILGGTFDPIHHGHLRIARAVIEQKLVDKVLLMPSGKPPHKEAQASAQDRLAMTMLSAFGMEGVEVSPLESTALTISYTAETLERLAGLYPGVKLYLILGEDALGTVPKWKHQEKLRTYCAGILAAPRAGTNPTEDIGIPVRRIEMEELDLSASLLRENAGQDLDDMTPAAEYIRQHALYGASDCETTQKLRATMSVSRFQHTLSVATTAVCLAYIHGVDPKKAHQAGLLHDCAKGMRIEDQLQWIQRGGIEVDEEERGIVSICHAPAGVAVARMMYGVEDPEVLSAIRWHTTGRRKMAQLDKIVYLADMIEPLRRPFPGLTRIRQIAYRNLDAAVIMAARISADHILSGGRKLLRRTLEMLEEAGEKETNGKTNGDKEKGGC